MNIKNQQAINQVQRKQRASDQIEKQDLQLKELVKEKVIERQGMEYLDAETFRKTHEISMKRIRSFLCSLDVLEDVNLSSNAKSFVSDHQLTFIQ
ncbi:MAG: hypothetical protein JWQ34_283 [Mucilaginibacter sp.]|uniref:hypothetical protein n=1 Tax=Mucilaginibacter sp. TaxID=1882438 RepID=UPI00262C4470|nr:hypothetical protein [Mucilaginibacter sp.]MDB5002058.1 hypothetical protein [Mucilaginibacter sp.]